MSYEADLNSYPKWWCPPRSHYASSLCPSSQPLSFITTPSSCPQFSIAELPSREHLGYQPHWGGAFPPPLVSLGTRGADSPFLCPELLSGPITRGSHAEPPEWYSRKLPRAVMILWQEGGVELPSRLCSCCPLPCWGRGRERNVGL